MNMNRTSNYHLFDLTRGQVGSKLTKKSGNYLGKLRAKNVNRTEYALVGQNSDKEEFGGILFDRLSFVTQLKEGSQPRKMSIVVPELAADYTPVPHRIYDEDTDGMSEMLKQADLTVIKRVHVFESNEPVFENGNYRLNFRGRVSVPSVKNFQLVSPHDIDDIICQFGKIGEDRFHLDFKAPLNAFQAFSLALCQFNL
jgi:tubby-related protein 1